MLFCFIYAGVAVLDQVKVHRVQSGLFSDQRKVPREYNVRTGQAHNAFPEYTTNLKQFVVQSFLKPQVVSLFVSIALGR